MLASLMASGAGHISTAVALEDDPEPVVGSFTVGGLTYAIVSEGEVALVSVGSDAAALAAGPAGTDAGPLAGSDGAPSGEDSGSGVPTSPSPSPEGASSDGVEGEDAPEPVVLAIPESVEFDGVTYSVTSFGPRAFAGCDADVVTIPAAVGSVDGLAFRGSAVASVEVDDGNSHLSSYDGMLFDAEGISLLLIPEGKQGAARIPSTAEAVPPSAFSHCVLVTSISVDAGGAAYLSRNGSLYDASGETLLRVPAGATEIEIADGCTTVAAGALEGCVKLRSIQAPASVVEVSPDVLGAASGSVPVAAVSSLGQIADEGGGLAAAAGDDGGQVAVVGDAPVVEDSSAEGSWASSDGEGGEPSAEAEAPDDDDDANPAQLTSLVALAAVGDDLLKVDPASIIVRIPEGADPAPWEAVGFGVEVAPSDGADDAEPVEGEPLDGPVPEAARDHDAGEPDGASSDGPVTVDEVTIGYGYANERSSADGAYERATPKIDAVLKLQPLTAEELMEGEAAAGGEGAPAGSGPAANGGSDGADGADGSDASAGDGTAADAAGTGEGEPTLASKLADLPEDSQATASFLYEGCLYVIDPEGGAALVAVDPKRLAECVEDPTTLILPDYVDDGQWSYPLTRIAKGAFRGSGIERLWIPASATYLDYALEGCETLRYVEISEDSPVYSSKGGCLYDKSGETLWMAPEGIGGPPAAQSLSHAMIQRTQWDAWRLGICRPESGVSSAVLPLATSSRRSYTQYTNHTFTDTLGRVITYNGKHLVENDWPGTTTSCESHSHDTWGEILMFIDMVHAPDEHNGAQLNIARENGYLGGVGRLRATWRHTSDYVAFDQGDRIVEVRGLSTSPDGPYLPYETSVGDAVASYVWCDSRDNPNYVTAAWNPNGGTCDPASSSTTAGHTVLSPVPSRTGYTCTGWWTAAAGGTKVCAPGGTTGAITSNVTYYAQWSPITYNVRYFDHAGNLKATDTKSYGATFSLRANPGWTAAGYTAQGWARSKGQSAKSHSFSQSVSNLSSAQGANVDFYVAETANRYAVSFNANGGTGGQSTNVTATYGSAMPGISTTKPARTGYAFGGWYDTSAASGGTQYYTSACASARTWNKTSNATLYARWTANPYSVRYFTKAGAHIATDAKSYGATFALRGDPGRTTPGYTAIGWARSAGQSTASHSFGQSVSNLATSGNADFYLAEVPNSYSVTLDAAFPAFAQGPTYEGYGPHGMSKDAGTASVTATYDSAMPSATMPRATGYRFEGYFDDAGTCYYNADGSSARTWDKPGAATLHARWSVERHELTLDVGNGEVPSAPGRGWVRDAGDSGLYRLSYSIEWVEESGGSLRIQLPVPATKPGYATFDGWTGGGIAKPSKSVIVQPWELADRAYAGAFSGVAAYAATLDLAGGRFDPAPEGWAGSGDAWSRSFTVESDAFSLPAPSRDGYSFEGWAAVAADGSLGTPERDVTVPKGSWGDRSWRAAWRAIEYNISYELAGGTMSGQRTSYTKEDPDFELPVPTREGYSFQGWEVTGANGAGLSQQGVVTTVKQGTWGDLHATAKWATASYVASLDLAGGSFASAPDGWSEAGGSWTRGFTVESDAFELPTPKRAGHDFQGWALVAPDGSLGSPAASVTVPKGTVGDRSYRAVWQARSYSVTWHYSGQVVDGQQSATSSQAYGSPIAFPSRPSVADPARDHYAFEGWFTEREGGERVEAGDYLLESDSTFYARWSPIEYVVHLHLGDDDAYGEHKAHIEQSGQALPLAPDGHFDMPYTVEDEVRLPTVTDDPTVPKPVREGMSFVGWVECAEDGSFDPDLVPSMEVVLPVGSHGDRHYRAVWSFALRFEVPSAVSFRFDLADDPAFADAPYGPVHVVSGDGVEMRSLSLGQLAVADVAVDVAGADPDAIVSDRSKVQLRVMDASLPDPWTGWVPLPTTSAPERVDPYDLGALGFGDGNALAPLASKPLRYDIEVQDPVTTLAGEVDASLARIVFTVKGLW